MTEASIASRLADLQVQLLGRILTLAIAADRILDEWGPIEDEHERLNAGHLTNLVDLIADVARQAGAQAEGIERDAGRLEKR